MKPYLVTTKHRGVFAGLISDDQDIGATTLSLTEARMAIRFGTTRGVMELAHTGPTKESRIGSPADIPVLHDVTAVSAITPEAWEKWQSA